MSKELTQEWIGKLLTEEAHRDAIHIAVAPVVAKVALAPGQHVGLWSDDYNYALPSVNPIGIVDPFLAQGVAAGERFFLFLYPNTITSLRHEWAHPAFAASPSVDWLKAFAEEYATTYEALMEGVRDGYVCFGRTSGPEAMNDPDTKVEFWSHYEAVVGMRVPTQRKADVHFRCAC